MIATLTPETHIAQYLNAPVPGSALTAHTQQGCGSDCSSSPPLQTSTEPSSPQLTISMPPSVSSAALRENAQIR
jgi:hypothetical protein